MRSHKLAKAIKTNYMLVADFENFILSCKDNENELISGVLASLEAPDNCFTYYGDITIQDLIELNCGGFTENIKALVNKAIEDDQIDITDLHDDYAPNWSDYEDEDAQEMYEQDCADFDSDILKDMVMQAVTDIPEVCIRFCQTHLEQLKNIAIYSFLENLDPSLISLPKNYTCRNQLHEFVYLLNDSEIPISLTFDNYDPFSNSASEVKATLFGVNIGSSFIMDKDDELISSISRAMGLSVRQSNNIKYRFNDKDIELNLTDYSYKSILNFAVCESVFSDYYKDLLTNNERYGHSLFNEHSEVIDFLNLSESSAALRADFCLYLANINETDAVESLINNATSFDAQFGKLIAQEYIRQFLKPDSNYSYFPSASLINMAELKDEILGSTVPNNSECFLNTRIELSLLPHDILLKHKAEMPLQQLHLGLSR